MDKLKLVNIFSYLVAASGFAVILGWIFDISILKSLLPGLVEMKFVTAISFIASGIVLYSVSEKDRENSLVAQILLPGATLSIFILMTTLFITSVFGIGTSIDNLFIKEVSGAAHTVAPGRPSIPTMVNFILIAIAGSLISLEKNRIYFWFGLVISIIGGVAVFGYVVNAPILYYLVIGKNTAMALNTAILFVIIGIGLILCGKSASKQN